MLFLAESQLTQKDVMKALKKNLKGKHFLPWITRRIDKISSRPLLDHDRGDSGSGHYLKKNSAEL